MFVTLKHKIVRNGYVNIFICFRVTRKITKIVLGALRQTTSGNNIVQRYYNRCNEKNYIFSHMSYFYTISFKMQY